MEDLNLFETKVSELELQINQPYRQENRLINEKWDAAPKGLKILANIVLNFLLIALAAVTAYFFCIAFRGVIQAAEVFKNSDEPPTQILQKIAILTVMSGFIFFTLQDFIRLLDRRLKLPFELSLHKASNIYWSRAEIYLLAVSFNAILLCLYLSFPSMALVSGVFLASVFSIAILAIQKSAPMPKIGFFLSLAFFGVVIATIPIVQAMYSPVNTSDSDAAR